MHAERRKIIITTVSSAIGGDMKANTNRDTKKLFFILSALVVLTTFSCSGLFTSRSNGMGTLCIGLPESGARLGWIPEDISTYKLSIISEQTGEAVIPTQAVNVGSFSAEIPTGTYSVIVQGLVPGEPLAPAFIGRANGVIVKENETTAADITMIYMYAEIDLPDGELPALDWGSAKLPTLTRKGCVFDGWYILDEQGNEQKITELPATNTEGLVEIDIIAHFKADYTSNFPAPNTPGVFYATQNGVDGGDGSSPEKPMSINDTFSILSDNTTLYLLDDVILGGTIVCDVTIIGAGGDCGVEKVTVSGVYDSIINFGSASTSIVKNVIVDGANTKLGINNAGNLTMEGCVIQNCTQGIYNLNTLTVKESKITNCTTNGGIYNSGSLTLINTDITDCSTASDYGGGINCSGTNASLSITGGSITSCTAVEAGGGIYIDWQTTQNMTITGCTIKNCSAGYGGGLYSDCQGLVTITNSNFISCESTNENYPAFGGGLVSTENITLSSTTFTSCTAKGTGKSLKVKGTVNGHSISGEKYIETDITSDSDLEVLWAE